MGGYRREETKGWYLTKAVEYARNAVRNHDDAIGDDEFFKIFQKVKPPEELKDLLGDCLPKGEVAEFKKRRGTEGGNAKQLLSRFFSKPDTRDHVRGMLVSIADDFLKSIPPDDDQHTRERFQTVVRLMKLSPLEAEILTLCYLFESELLNSKIKTIRKTRDGWVDTIALHLDVSLGEIRHASREDGNLRRYHVIDRDFDISGDIAGYLGEYHHAPLTNRFYSVCDEETLPWGYFEGTLVAKHGTILKQMLSKRPANQGLHILLYGCPGSGKSSFAATLSKEAGLTCYKVRQNTKNEDSGKSDSSRDYRVAAIQIAADQISPEGSVVIVDEADDIVRDVGAGFFSSLGGRGKGETKGDKGLVNTVMDSVKVAVIWITNTELEEIDDSTRRRFDYSIRFTKLSTGQRRNIWKNVVKRFEMEDVVSEEMQERLARKFETSIGGISIVLKNVKNILASPNGGSSTDVEALIDGLMKQHCELLDIGVRDGSLAVGQDYSLEGLNFKGDVPLPKIEDAIRKYMEEREKGGANQKDTPRMNLLLSGAPGTGKSEWVKHISHVLDAKVLIKMPSDILNCYVGETEQNIKRAFEEAENENAILFFDEIDGLLQSREGAHRNYEISQVNQLLYLLEHFNGVFIGATNFSDRLDPAILRRCTFKIRFDYLDDKGKLFFFDKMFASSLTDSDKARLSRIPNLAVGDFRNIRQSFYYLGKEECTADDYLSALERESDAKRQGKSGKMGF